jgi:hypothetical protein
VELDEAMQALAEVDAREALDRAARLVELTALLGEDDIGFSGQAAHWLFEDVKATWIYGYFAATVLSSHAFCVQQLAGLLRLMPDDPALPESAVSLELLAALAEDRSVIDLDLRARMITLDDSNSVYASAGLHEYHRDAERRAIESERFTNEHSLLADARLALGCSVAVVHRRMT